MAAGLAAAPSALGAGAHVAIADTATSTSRLTADMEAAALTARGFTVVRSSQPSAGAAAAALAAGTIDAYVTDTATMVERIYLVGRRSTDSAMRSALAAQAAARGQAALGLSPADDAPAVACTRAVVSKYAITGVVRLAAVAGFLRYGATPSHMIRADGYWSLRATFRSVLVRPGQGRFLLIPRKQVDCVLSSGTEPRAARLKLVTLRDLKRRLAGTPRRTVTVVSGAYMGGAPAEFQPTIDLVASKLSRNALIALRGYVEVDGRASAPVALSFMRSTGVVPPA